MGLLMLPSMLSLPPHSHRALRLRCGGFLFEKLMFILLSQYNAISVLKIYLIERSLSQLTSRCPKLTAETLTLKTPQQHE